ncbi:hypothetical protein NDI38_11130 [Stenomitos frigidus AS-A4]|uniref:Uncharacterized protein n=1 Tax=Stenomitos frigidus AS-A4 TaxID=2933935 RepID=A0ABV0KIC4_9CYAN
MGLSEVMTMLQRIGFVNAVAFHGSGFRTFKAFYTLCMLPHWRCAFPKVFRYTRFIELMP